MTNRIQNITGQQTTPLPNPRLHDDLIRRLRSWSARSVKPIQPVDVPTEKIVRHLPKLAFNLEEAALVLGLSTRTLRRLVHRGLLHTSKATRRFIFSRTEIERFLQETTNN
jgi:excisionase family DNA binding protein